MIDTLKDIFGQKCTAVNVNGNIREVVNVPDKQMTLCEAVNCSFTIPLRIHSGNLSCPGARRSLGFNSDDAALAKSISEKSEMSEEIVIKELTGIPALKTIRHINLGLQEYMEKDARPDLFIMYLRPSMVTKLAYSLAQKGYQVQVSPYFYLSVCGNVIANTYSKQVASISFGLPYSRKFGGIEYNEVVAGIPRKMAKLLIRDFKPS